MKKIKVAVLMGGTSSERDISLVSGREVAKGLNKNKYDVIIYDPKTDLIKLAQNRKKIDVVFPVLHGKWGEDGTIQGFLELLELPYVGSGVLASSLAMDKVKTKEIYQFQNIPTPKYKIISNKDLNLKETKAPFLPCVVKPVCQGSSMGTTIVKDKRDFPLALKNSFKFESDALIEEYVEGIEITVPVLGNENPVVLPVIEIVPPKGEFFNRKVKYDGTTQEIVPARISEELTQRVQELAAKAHLSLGCRGISRTDMIIKSKNESFDFASSRILGTGRDRKRKKQNDEIYVLETNTIPGLTPESLFPKAARAVGINFSDLVDKLIDYALEPV